MSKKCILILIISEKFKEAENLPKRISNKIYISFDYAGRFFDRTIEELSGIYEYHSVRNKAATFIKQRGEELFYLVYLETQQSELSGWYIQDSKSFDSKKEEYYLRLLTKGLLSFLIDFL